MNRNPYDSVFENRIMTASKADLTLMLYEGGIKFCNIAIAALEKKEIEKSTKTIFRIMDIVRELQLTLDHQYDIARQMNIIYDYMYHHLMEANRTKDPVLVDEVLYFFREYRDTWKEAMKLARAM